ncbi:hypothetical protein TPHA_0C01930 [Tetrapisispora phaffii CBS 4417]|uniref:mRNA export factor GLE1 n=1 Tax=Tetrapisispora phaffii (strain ATCC 24235 / CBS 4417 / NBRC 1672 / NRRL Y-8282 / UCD 70-5) TaxID=1071381 RepID=G8BRH2_TETPH|nr:hypothetical protein TPHA_0C01930 [Tetrapisispora phaffii CBS 4417]CCE62348.1 hypothetical protein TPHA_0C01930 [Tetrapisispora phaffii CBS 4417]
MKFAFDDLLNSSENDDLLDKVVTSENIQESPLSSPNLDYTYINESEEDESIPHLRLPRKQLDNEIMINSLNKVNNMNSFVELRKSEETPSLNPELLQYMKDLDLDSRLPRINVSLHVLVSNNGNLLVNNNQADGSLETVKKIEIDNSKEKAVLSIQHSFTSRLNALVNSNLEQVKDIKKRKKEEEQRIRKEREDRERKIEEERRRKKAEEELKRKEEEERLRLEKEALDKQKKELELKEKARKEEEALKTQQEKLAELKYNQNVGKEITNFKEINKTFLYYKDKIKEIKRDIIEPVKNGDKNFKSILSKHKRKINPKFGQLTNSTQQLKNVYEELTKLVDETKTNQLSYNWILNFICKAIVSQAETEVRVKPASSLALGKLSVLLMIRYEELTELLKARFIKKCPFVIGFSCKIDTEEGRLRMGWKRKEDNKWEEETTYDERMGGMVTLFSVITRLPVSTEFNGITAESRNPIPISESWRFLARICNMDKELLTNSHFIILCSWWEAAGKQFVEHYGKQGEKLLRLVAGNLINSVSASKFIGAARLSILIEEWITTGSIKSFPEMDA